VADQSSTPAHAADSGRTLRGSIGVAGIVFLVVAAAAPLTTVGGALPVMLGISNGPGVPMAYVVVAAVLLLFSVGYAAMSHHVVDTGAFYAYVARGIGPRTGLGAAALALLAYTAVQAAVYGLASVTLQGIITRYGGPEIPWWVLAGVLLIVVGLLGYRSIDLGAKVLGVLLVLEIAVVVVLSAAILVQGGPEGYALTTFAPATFFQGAPGVAVVFAVASFIGFEGTAIYSEEARDPRRTVPLATYVAVTLIGVFYAIASWTVVVAVGPSRVAGAAAQDPSGLVLAIGAQFLGPAYADVMVLLLLTSLFAALLAFHNAIARYLYALSRAKIAPGMLARTHPRHGSPYLGSLAQTAATVALIALFALAGADPVLTVFPWMSGLATVSILVLMVLTAVAITMFFRRRPVDTRLWNTRIAPVLGLLGLIFLTGLVLANFTTLISGSAMIATVLLSVVVLAFATGIVVAVLRLPTAVATAGAATAEPEAHPPVVR
jgi:amino acid transporter